MKVCNLASGSTGNCTYIETSKYKILIDLGKTKKYIKENLESIGVNYEDIDYVFLTHTHDDHTSALKTFLKKHKAFLVITNEMAKDIPDLENYNVITYDKNPDIEGLDIKSYKMSHDSGEIRSFVVSEDGKSICYITDTGYINSKYFKDFKDKDVYFIESNHDIEMLQHGPYPDWLKKRVLSDVGHLSNKFAGIYLSKLITDKTKKVTLIHLSEKNNTEECALDTVKGILSDHGIDKLDIVCSKPNTPGKVIKL